MEKIKKTIIQILIWISIVGSGMLFLFSIWSLKDLDLSGKQNIGYTIGRLLGPILLGWLFWSTLPKKENN